MKKVILFILMIALVVTCAVSGIAFAGSSLNRDYDVTYDAKFTADATTQNPGYLVFDKPVSAANGTITMTMDVIAGTNLTGKFNFGFALLTSPNGNALTDSNSMAWYNSATTISGSNRNKGFLSAGNNFVMKDVTVGEGEEQVVIQVKEYVDIINASLYYNPSTTIKNGYSIKVEYVAPTTTTDGSITLSTKLTTATTWTKKKSYTAISYNLMPQADNLYFAVTGWSDDYLTENDPYRSFVFANPLLTDGTTSTNIVKANNVDFVPYSNFEDAPDEYTATYKLTWGKDTRHIDELKAEWGTDKYPSFYETGVGNVTQGYFGNLEPVALSDNEALVMEFNVNNFNMSEGASFGFGVMLPEMSKVPSAYTWDDYYASHRVGATGSSLFTYGRQTEKMLYVTGWNMVDNAYPGITTDPSTGSSYPFNPAQFMGSGKSVKFVYVPYSYGADGVKSLDDLGGSFTVWSKDMSAPDTEYKIAYSVTDLGENAGTGYDEATGGSKLFIVMYVNMASGVQSLNISNYTTSVREIPSDRAVDGANVVTGDVVYKVDPNGTSTAKAVSAGAGVYTYYVNKQEIKPVIGDNYGDGFALYADRYANDGNDLDKASSALYYNHGDATNDKLSSAAVISFDIFKNDGLKLVLNNAKNTTDGAVLFDVPVATSQNGEMVVGDVNCRYTATPTTKYTLKMEAGKAVIYATYNVAVYNAATDELITKYVDMIKLAEKENAYSDFYFGFYVETMGEPKIASIDNVEIKDDPAVIGVNELDYLCIFDTGLPPSKFTTIVVGDNSMAALTDRQHTLAVTNGSIVDSDVYSMLASDGDVVVFKPDEAQKGYHFDRWETSAGEVYSRDEMVTIVAHKNLSLVAKYELDEHLITILEGGKITFYEGSTVDLTTINAKYGDSIKITADDNSAVGYVFGGWYNGNDKITDEKVYAFDVTDTYDRLKAVYVPEEISIKVVNGTVLGEGETVASNDVIVSYDETIIATPNNTKTGWQFARWEFNGEKVDSTLVGADNTYTFEANESGTLTAIFEKVQYNVTVVGGYVSVINDDVPTDPVTKLAHGDEVIFTANAAPEGKKFDGWYEGTKLLSTDRDYVVVVDGAISIEAKFVDVEETQNSGCAGFIAPPTNNGGGNNSLWLVVGILALAVVAVAVARRNRRSSASK